MENVNFWISSDVILCDIFIIVCHKFFLASILASILINLSLQNAPQVFFQLVLKGLENWLTSSFSEIHRSLIIAGSQ